MGYKTKEGKNAARGAKFSSQEDLSSIEFHQICSRGGLFFLVAPIDLLLLRLTKYAPPLCVSIQTHKQCHVTNASRESSVRASCVTHSLCTGPHERMLHWKWIDAKPQPIRTRSGHQISCCLVYLQFLCDILPSRPVV